MSQFAAPKQAGKLLRTPLWLRLEISERRLLLRSVDLLLIGISVVAALLIWSFWGQRPLTLDILRDQVLWAALLLLGWPFWLALTDMYHVRMSARLASSVVRVLVGALVITFAYLVLFFISSRAPSYDVFPRIISGLASNTPLRLVPIGAIAGSTCLLLVWRTSYIWLLSGPLTWRRVLILGAGGAGTTLCATMRNLHDTHYHIIGFVDDDPAKQQTRIDGVPVLGGHEALPRLIDEHAADEIVVAISADIRSDWFQTLMDCHERGIAITPMPLLYERLTGKIAVEHIGSQWYAALPIQQHAARTAFQFIKRLIDLAVGLFLGAVFVLLCPAIALAIRLDSPGPLFYRQERVGLHGRRFYITKFRSMTPDAERAGEARWATRDDQRITRVGRVLRRMRLDELPQALNVLRGEMSVVGPRPERPQFIEQLQRQIPFYRTRLAARPGLTGWAQINYGYGNTVEDALVKLQYDLYYLKHQSPWFDLKIILRTIGVVLRMQGQ